jgi:hypothetical protein
MAAIVSLKQLAWILETPLDRLRQIAADVKSHYQISPLLDKKKRKVRLLKVPSDALMEIQRRINRRILSPITLGESVHGGGCRSFTPQQCRAASRTELRGER